MIIILSRQASRHCSAPELFKSCAKLQSVLKAVVGWDLFRHDNGCVGINPDLQNHDSNLII